MGKKVHEKSSLRLIQSLREPAVYEHAVSEVQVVETHISWVLLTGRYAYKLKKPVNLGFVDFSTLDKRRHFCHEELRLNRRLAPELYLDVLPITGTPEAPRLGGSGEPIEFAVRMKQFPQEALLSHLLEQGRLPPHGIELLAREVAAFHGRIAVAGRDSRFGTPEQIREPVQENFRHLFPITTDARPKMRLQCLQDWSEQEFSARTADFTLRKQGGFVRECHGDMHLGNMILLDEKITVFDCIEFNEDFRWIDVLSEAAFVVMDLEDRARPDLAHRFLNTYLELTGDYAGLAVLPFYLCYRALVRAKVAAIRMRQHGLSKDEQSHYRNEFDGYLDLAERSTRPPGPMLIVTHGLSGSGKTSGTQRLLEALGAVRIRSDIERKRLYGLAPLGDRATPPPDHLYSADATLRTYARLGEQAAVVVCAGFPVIVDATFLKRAQRDEFRRLAQGLNVPFLLLDLQATEETLRRRVARREREGRDASDANLEVLSQQLVACEPLADDERPSAITVDTEAPDAADQLLVAVRDRHA